MKKNHKNGEKMDKRMRKIRSMDEINARPKPWPTLHGPAAKRKKK